MRYKENLNQSLKYVLESMTIYYDKKELELKCIEIIQKLYK